MPQRFLRPGIRTSDAWNSVSFGAQSLYIRILTLVDDFGRYDARIPILHGECFALRNDIKPQQTAAFRSELQTAYLVDIYSVDGKEYLQVLKWQERSRSEHSKYPDPQDSAAERSVPQEKDASLAIAIASTSSSSPSVAAPSALSSEIEDIWQSYPRKIKKPEAIKAIQKALKKVSAPFLLERTRAYAQTQPINDRFTPHPATWFNAEQYNDDPVTWTPSNNGQNSEPIYKDAIFQ